MKWERKRQQEGNSNALVYLTIPPSISVQILSVSRSKERVLGQYWPWSLPTASCKIVKFRSKLNHCAHPSQQLGRSPPVIFHWQIGHASLTRCNSRPDEELAHLLFCCKLARHSCPNIYNACIIFCVDTGMCFPLTFTLACVPAVSCNFKA
eukprot:1158197-Pelagomonas_calceolata.AAC.9